MNKLYFLNKLKNYAGENKKFRTIFFTLIISSIMILSAISSIATSIDFRISYLNNSSNTTYLTQIWTTDAYGNPKTDFFPGDLVYIHGIGFLNNHNVNIDVIRPDSNVDSGSIISDSGGSFIYIYDLNGILGAYTVVADDGTNSAQTSFTDGQGAIWTTKNDCGDESQDVNHFDIGDHVYINGDGFDPYTSYSWNIKGKPGGASCDPGSIVASGTVITDSAGEFCFDAYTVQPDDCGEYQVKVGNKGDNYRVDNPIYNPSIDLEKSTNGFDADSPSGPSIPCGDPIEWRYDVENTGDVDLIDVVITDDVLGYICTIPSLPVGATDYCTANGVSVPGQYANVGSVTADSIAGGSVTDSDPSHYFGLECPGCLEIDKNVDWFGSTPDPGQTFTVTVTGPSHPSPGVSYVFGSSGGTWTLNDLTPGSYSVVESDPGLSWIVTPGLSQTVTVSSGTPCASVSITNTLYPGCLEIEKYVDWAGLTPDPGQTFTVTVTGPSHPSPGISHVFGSSGGWWTLYDLIPGVYTVTETDPGSPWVVSPGLTQTVTVEPISMCEYVSITNFYYAGCLEITKIVEWWSVTPDPGQIFTVTVTGPSHPSPGISHVFGSSGGTWTLDDLTPGVYTVTETDPGPNWIVTPGLTQTVSVSVGTPCASVSITNMFDAGCLNIEKYVEWGSVTPDTGQTFTITVTGPSHPSPGITYVFDHLGGMWTLYDLIPGVYTVTETDPGSPWIVTPGLTQTTNVYPGTPCAYVDITNTLEVGCLEVTKVVDWGSVTPDPGQTFTVTVTGPSHPSPGIILVFGSSGGTSTLYDLIPGPYTVVETNPGSPWVVTPGLSQTVTVNLGTPCASATITNTYNVGCLEITKIVDWVGVTPDTGQTFTVTVEGPSYPIGITHTFGYTGGTWTLNDLIPGSYIVIETDPGYLWEVTGLSQIITVNPGTPCASTTITNTHRLGCLEITKIVDWIGVNPDTGQTFTVTVTGPSYPSGISHNFGYNGGTWTLNDLITGSYTVVETDPGTDWSVTPGLSQTVTVNPGTPCATVSITNEFKLGCLEITKIVEFGNTVNSGSITETFEICITGPSYPSGDCKTISETGGTLSWYNLIPGTYTITETDPGPEWIVTGDTSILVEPGTPCATATVTNTYDPGCLEITKFVNWNGATPYPITFEICITGPSYPSGDCKTISETGGTLSWYNLIPGTYTITETDPGPEWIVTGDTSILVEPGTPCATAYIINDHLTPSIEIIKEVWNDDTQQWVRDIRVPNGTDILFRITVSNTGNMILSDVTVTDTMSSQLEYRNQANIPPVSSSPHQVSWHFDIIAVGETIIITFHAEAVHTCHGWNEVEAITLEGAYDYDMIPVKVTLGGQPVIDITMKVWDTSTSSWVNNIQRGIGSDLQFKIKVNNTANSILHDINIEATLPNQVVYNGNSNYPPASSSSDHITWHFSQLTPGETKEITYNVLAVEYGYGNNDATVTTLETFYDQDNVLVTIINYPTIQLNYPTGGETLEEITNIEWYAIDNSDPNLDIYLYYSNNDGISWRGICANSPAIPVDNTGTYQWDTTEMSDGEYKIKIEAVNLYNAISHDTSDPFTINNGITYVKVSDVYVTDITMNSNTLVKNGDNVEISAGITNGQGLKKDKITADLTGFGGGVEVPANNYDGFNAIWMLVNVECSPSDGVIKITVTANNIDSKSTTIIADNKAPDISIIKPINGLYYNNNRIIPLFRTLIIGQITVEIDSNEIDYTIDKTEFYLDNELKFTDTELSFKWDINFRLFGRHKLEIMCYDKIGNIAHITKTISIFNI